MLRMTLSEDARVRVVVRRSGARGRLRTLRVLRRDGAEGAVRLRLGRLPRGGLHRVTVSATDAAGNRSPRTRLRFRVRGWKSGRAR